MPMIDSLRYFVWAMSQWPPDTACPYCRRPGAARIDRKYVVTTLHRCSDCGLMFRVPKGSEERSEEFYQNRYSQGFTTDCPDAATLEKLKSRRFVGSERDYTRNIALIQAAGVVPGMSLFEFGCSWGYGSWQIRQEGYRVLSWEISEPRAKYAVEMLGCELRSAESLPKGSVDCFFSSHVIEHLDNPKHLWNAARYVLKPGGALVLIMPNGQSSNPTLRKWWNRVHPLLLDTRALLTMAERSGFDGRTYGSAFDYGEVRAGLPGSSMTGDELALVARFKRG